MADKKRPLADCDLKLEFWWASQARANRTWPEWQGSLLGAFCDGGPDGEREKLPHALAQHYESRRFDSVRSDNLIRLGSSDAQDTPGRYSELACGTVQRPPVSECLSPSLRVRSFMPAEKEERNGKGKSCEDRKSTRLNSSHSGESRMPSSA